MRETAHPSSSLRGMVLASMMGAATAVGAYIIVPLPPVPITLQTLFMAVSALLLGGRLGAMSQVVYVTLGILGLPVFSGGKAGIGVLLGPTGGYLIGFVLGAYVTGTLVERMDRPGVLKMALAVALGYVTVYIPGAAQLSIIAGLSPIKAVSAGVLPFLPGDAVKSAAAAAVVYMVRDYIKVPLTARQKGRPEKSRS